MDGVGTGTDRETEQLTQSEYHVPFERTLNSNIDRGTDRSIESGSAGVLSSLRCCYLTDCEVTGDLPTNSRPHPPDVWSTSYSKGEKDRAGESDIVSSHDGRGGRECDGDGGWLCLEKNGDQ